MKLRVGQEAPKFDFEDIYGQEVSLKKMLGNKVYLSFFRSTSCPFCNLRAYQMIKMTPRLKDKIQMVFIFETKKSYLLNSSFTEELKPIQVIGDTEKELYHLYGAESSFKMLAKSPFSRKYYQQLKTIKDLDLEVSKEDKSFDKTQVPADFLIDEEGLLQVVHYGNNITDRLDEDIIVKYAEAGKVVNI